MVSQTPGPWPPSPVGLGRAELQLGEPGGRLPGPLEGASSSLEWQGEEGQGGGRPRCDSCSASRVAEELAEQTEGALSRLRVSEEGEREEGGEGGPEGIFLLMENPQGRQG